MTQNLQMERRIELAEALLVSAEHSSEAEIRNSLSRMYYAIYHLATAAIGSRAHGEFADLLDEVEPGLGARFKGFEDLRSKADYNPDFVIQVFGNYQKMRTDFPGLLQEGREIYEQLLKLVRQDADSRAD